jgi:glutamate racemase
MYDKSIGDEYKEEYKLCGIDKATNILHIGCGAYPLTEMVLTTVSSGHVTGIDKNAATVTKAQHVITRRNLTNRISIQHGDGCTYPITSFDTVIVSSCSLPKVKILEHIAQTTTLKTNIIVREVDIACPDVDRFLASRPDINVLHRINHNPFPFIYPMGWVTYHIQKR